MNQINMPRGKGILPTVLGLALTGNSLGAFGSEAATGTLAGKEALSSAAAKGVSSGLLSGNNLKNLATGMNMLSSPSNQPQTQNLGDDNNDNQLFQYNFKPFEYTSEYLKPNQYQIYNPNTFTENLRRMGYNI